MYIYIYIHITYKYNKNNAVQINNVFIKYKCNLSTCVEYA